eukprot:g23036.t1
MAPRMARTREDLKRHYQLRAEEVDLALIFVSEDADWGTSSKQKLDVTGETFQRSEPLHWSFLTHVWPKTFANKPIKHLRQWKRKGLHEDVLRWLSDRPPRQLRD